MDNKKKEVKDEHELIRLNKFLSDAGVCSRREADRMIEQGRITVNGEKAVSGQKISLKDEICVDHVPVVKNEKKVLQKVVVLGHRGISGNWNRWEHERRFR